MRSHKLMIIKGYIINADSVLEMIEYIKTLFIGDHGKMRYPFLYTNMSSFNHHQKKFWLLTHRYELNDVISRFNIQLYYWSCCTIFKDLYIVGRNVKSYDQLSIKCDNCTSSSPCVKCLGQTNNGYYDIETISKNIVTIDEKQICKWCYNDHREISHNCHFCHCDALIVNGIKLIKKDDDDERIKPWIQNLNTIEQYVYMIDYCLSCKPH